MPGCLLTFSDGVTATAITITFREAPVDVFGVGATGIANQLRFRIWPETELGLSLAGKVPGAENRAQLQEMVFVQHSGSDMRPYDRLIGAAQRSDRLCWRMLLHPD